VVRRAKIERIPWSIRYVVAADAASRVRKALVTLTHRHCTVEFGKWVRLGPGFTLYIPGRGTLIVGDGVDFRRGFTAEVHGNGRLVIGDGCVFTNNALIQCSTSIEIGPRCAFGQSVLIVDGYHRYKANDRHWMEQGYDYRPITIGAGAGVADKCTVQSSLGERAMVASGSRVTKPIPAFCLAAGSPARVVEYFGPEEERPPELRLPVRKAE
jgi:acetyltransferase-like isoleucine patch superfamily enzyme